jgi:hypothetical protein
MKRISLPRLFEPQHQGLASAQAFERPDRVFAGAQATVGQGPPHAGIEPNASAAPFASTKRLAHALAPRSSTLAAVARLARLMGWALAHRSSTLASVAQASTCGVNPRPHDLTAGRRACG